MKMLMIHVNCIYRIHYLYYKNILYNKLILEDINIKWKKTTQIQSESSSHSGLSSYKMTKSRSVDLGGQKFLHSFGKTISS